MVYSNFVTTVSPSHADEALYGDACSGSAAPLRSIRTSSAEYLTESITTYGTPRQTRSCRPVIRSTHRAQIRERRGAQGPVLARHTRRPVVAYIGRLDEQKGMDLVHHALFYTLAHGGQFVLIGDAYHQDSINHHFWHLKGYRHNDQKDRHLEIGYRGRHFGPHLIYAGADLLVVPSMFEPCGLAPLIAMRHRNGARGAGDRRHDRHRVRPRPTRGARWPSAMGTSFTIRTTRPSNPRSAAPSRLWSVRPARVPQVCG